MPRPIRLDYPGAHFHVTSRGNEQRTIFMDEGDRRRFLSLLATTHDRFDVVCHAYCLMGNHYHLLVESGSGRFSAALQHINGSYGRFFNRRHERVGHLFQGRFKSNLIDTDSYLLEVVRYIELNPCRAALVADPAEWAWSSYRSRLGLAPAPEWLRVEPVMERFGQTEAGRQAYRDFILAGLENQLIHRKLKGDSIIGSPEFVAVQADRARRRSPSQKVPRRQRLADRPALGAIFEGVADAPDRRRRAVRACVGYGYRMTEVAAFLDLHYTTISRWVRAECDNS